MGQPSANDIRDSLLKTEGSVITYRTVKHGKRSHRAMAEAEYVQAVEQLTAYGFGRVVEFRVPRASKACKVFVKSVPDNWPTTTNVSRQTYEDAMKKPMHKYITNAMKDYLVENGHLS